MFSGVVPSVLILLTLMLSSKCLLLIKATVLGQRKEAIGKITQFLADPAIEFIPGITPGLGFFGDPLLPWHPVGTYSVR